MANAIIITFLGGPMDGFVTDIGDAAGEYTGGTTDQGEYVYGPYDGRSRTIPYFGTDYPEGYDYMARFH